MINNDNEYRPIVLAHYILENHTTIRATAKHFGIPKSTVHHDLSEKLRYLDRRLYREVKALMEENFSLKHINGGESTRKKYEALRHLAENNDIELV